MRPMDESTRRRATIAAFMEAVVKCPYPASIEPYYRGVIIPAVAADTDLMELADTGTMLLSAND